MSIRKGDTMIAGSDRMWKGTAAELAAALAAHEIPEGKQVMVTDDYDAGHPHPNWAAAVAITALPYTAPADGMIVGFLTTGVSNTMDYVYVNNVKVALTRRASQNSDYRTASIQCVVSKGDILTASFTPKGGTEDSLNFVPWKD